ncbi:MAG TPA: DNA replication and repair protein RecF [Thermomicrobiales bacterium]|nr:DNA replication and repair protein RecF [Thermomicrobiales bacterium]
MSIVDGVWVRRLELEHVRVYRDLTLDIPREGLRIVGRNGSGKSTLIEAIELVSTTRPRRGSLDADIIAHESGVDLGVAPYARVVGDASRGDVSARIEIFLQKGERKGATKKLLRVADRPRRASDVVGIIPTVSFAPDDLDLILGSPSVRRRFLDILLSQTDRRYLRTLSRYARILSQRNGLLKRHQADEGARVAADEFAFWDEQLVALGAYVIAARVRAMRGIRDAAAGSFERLSPESGVLEVRYVSSIQESGAWWESVETAQDALEAAQRIGVAFGQHLNRTQAHEIARGATGTGPHRDDLVVTLDGRPMERFGSRGQQRLAVVALKLAEIDVATDAIGARPVLLLDDVLSELDERHRNLLIETLRAHRGQLIVTAAEPKLVMTDALEELKMVTLTAPGVLATDGE